MVHFEGAHKITEPTLTAWELQKLMGLGINLGNVLETPFEGVFAATPTGQHFEMFREAGFAHCRIPVSWGRHMAADEPYLIDPKFMARVTELVTFVMDHGMVAVITAHHEWWIDIDDSNIQSLDHWKYTALPRFEAMWRQIAEHFRHHRQLLVFGILNEPHMLSVSSLNELHRCAMVHIRQTNPSRVVTISGKDFANPRWLFDNPRALQIPRDPMLMLEVHIMEPHSFTGTNPSRKNWGSEEEKQRVKELIDQTEVFGRARNLPIYVAEFGCSVDQKSTDERLHWLEINWKEMRRQGICACLWDDGERFSIYDRKTGDWDQAALAVLQRSLPGLQGVSMYRFGGGLGGDSNDPTADLQRRLENCFSSLNHHLAEVNKLKPLEEYHYSQHHDTRQDAEDEY
jgi:endoglucanase